LEAGIRHKDDIVYAELHKIKGMENLRPEQKKVMQAAAEQATLEYETRKRKLTEEADEQAVVTRQKRADPRAIQSAIERMQKAQRGTAGLAKVSDKTPKQAMDSLTASVGDGLDPREWAEQARIEAIMLSAPSRRKTMPTVLKMWGRFADTMLNAQGKHLPPSEGGLVAWSRTFRREGTYANYVSHLAMACDLAGLPSDSTRGRNVKRAKNALKKNQREGRGKLFLRRTTTAGLMEAVGGESQELAMLYLAAYVFLLRVTSEAHPLEIGTKDDLNGILPAGRQSVAVLHDGTLHLRLRKRKNRKDGSHLERSCWCHESTATCPVHVLGAWLAQFPTGTKPFTGIKIHFAMKRMRDSLKGMGVERAEEYRLHDFRRGHSEDLMEGGATLCQILSAGEWKTPAFLDYLDLNTLEKKAVVEAR
jgi:hypothetical protein